MTVFFASTIHSETRETQVSNKIIDSITALEHTVSTNLTIDNSTKTILVDGVLSGFNVEKMTASIKRSGSFFAKVSEPSTIIGYLIGIAIQLGKPVILFVPAGSPQTFFKSLETTSDRFQIIEYDTNGDISREVTMAVEYVEGSQDTRFNFFVSSDITSYLNWISKTKRVPRSVYLRELIDNDMKRSGNT